MKSIILSIFCACTLTAFGAVNNIYKTDVELVTTIETDINEELVSSQNHLVKTIDASSIVFSMEGDIIVADFASASCSVVIDNIRYSADNVGCFLCSQEGADERCLRVLNRRISEVFALF